MAFPGSFSTSSADVGVAPAAMIKLNDSNWFRWYPLIRWALKGRDLWDTVDPGPPATMVTGSLAASAWKVKEDKASSIIGFSCEPSLQSLILTKETPKEMFDTLKAHCLSTSYANRSRLRRKLYSIRATASTDMKKHIEEVSDALTHMEAIGISMEEADKIDAMLGSLPDSYDSLAQTMDVLAQHPLAASMAGVPGAGPSAVVVAGSGATYAKLCVYVLEQEHRQKRHTQSANEQAMLVQQHLAAARATANTHNKQRSGGAGGGGGRGKQKDKSKETCNYCKNKGHYARECRKRQAAEGSASNQNVKMRQSTDQVALATDIPLEIGSAWLAEEGSGSRDPLTFFVDSGASRHLVKDRRWFSAYKPAEQQHTITTANGAHMLVHGIGTVVVKMKDGQQIVIKGVAHVPEAVTNLLSVRRIADEGYGVVFNGGGCRIIRPDGTCVVTVARKDGQYVIHGQAAETSSTALTAAELTKEQIEAHLLHERLGHLNLESMRALAKLGVVPGMPSRIPDLPFCKGCAQGKQTKPPFSKREHSQQQRPLHTLVTDVVGPIEPPAPPALASARYAVITTCSHSRFRWVEPVQFKSQATAVLMRLLTFLSKEYPAWPIVNLRSDNGTEFVNAELGSYLNQAGITHQRTAPYTPQSNGQAERANRILIEATRSMLQERSLDQRLWPAAMVVAARLRNWSPSSTLPPGVVPAQMLLGPSARLPALRVFGSSCWVLGQGDERGKFAAKSTKLQFIGYAHSDTYRLWDAAKERVVISRNVIFDEADRSKLAPVIAEPASTPQALPPPAPLRIPETGDTHLADRLEEARRAVQARVDRARQEALETIREREQEAARQREIKEAEKASQSQAPAIEETSAPETIPPARPAPIRHSRRLAGENPELDQALTAAAIQPSENLEEPDPRTLKEARGRPDWEKWREAAQTELNALRETGTYKLVPLPPGTKPITGKWVLTRKYNADGSVAKYKARWVARGFLQQEGIDYDQTHSPTARMGSVRMMGAWSACEDLELRQWDFITAYLNGRMHSKVYIVPPEGVECPPGHVWLLLKALYGLKQSGREWNIELVQFLKSLGFKQSGTDYSLFTRTEGNTFVAIIVYVDDLIIAAPKGTDMKTLVQQLGQRFKGKDLGDAHHLLGIKIDRDRAKRTLSMSQGRYARQVLDRFGMSQCKPARTPMETGFSPIPRAEGEDAADTNLYRSLVGSLMYLAQGTRPDLSFAVSLLGRYASNPSAAHLAAAKRVLRYLRGTLDAKLTFTGAKGTELVGYVDADWAGDKTDRKSTSGYAFLMAGGAVTWGSKKQTSVATSTTEAEYVAASLAGREGVSLTAFLRDLGQEVSTLQILCDNQAAINVSKNPILHSRTKHIDIAHHWIRDAVNKGDFAFTYVPTEENAADVLTKALPQVKVIAHRERLGVRID